MQTHAWIDGPESSSHDAATQQLRIAIVATPRSGNTWLRGLLAATFGLQEMAVHAPDDLNWAALPDRMVVQIHWHAIEPFISLLRQHGFQVITLARSPYDVFISSLNYQQYVPEPLHWIGKSGNDLTLVGASPRSEAFLDFACGWVGENLLATSREWWQMPGTICVRYEELVADTRGVLAQIVAALGAAPARPIEHAARSYEIERLRIEYDIWHYHYWQGKPGMWRTLLTAREAEAIASAHAETFRSMGYVCDPDPELSEIQADLNWFRLQYNSVRKHLDTERAKHAQTRQTLQAERVQLLEQAMTDVRSLHSAAVDQLNATRDEFAPVLALLRSLDESGLIAALGRASVATATEKPPGFSATVRRLIAPYQRSA